MTTRRTLARNSTRISRLEDSVSSLMRTPHDLRVPLEVNATWLGLITDEGPDAEADYTDNRYWVERCYIDNTGTDNTVEATATAYVSGNPYDRTVTVTNFAESRYSTHLLQVGDVVEVRATHYKGSPQVAAYWMQQRPSTIPQATMSAATDSGFSSTSLAKLSGVGGTGFSTNADAVFESQSSDYSVLIKQPGRYELWGVAEASGFGTSELVRLAGMTETDTGGTNQINQPLGFSRGAAADGVTVLSLSTFDHFTASQAAVDDNLDAFLGGIVGSGDAVNWVQWYMCLLKVT